MEDTDDMQRVTTPFIRPGLESLEPEGQLDRTPTTSPGNTPGTPRRRLARGTLAPPVEVMTMAQTALPVRLVDPPARWGYRVKVDLDAARFAPFPEQPPVAGEIDTAPVRRLERTPWGLVAVLTAAIIAVLAGVYVLLNARAERADRVASEPAAPAPSAAPETVVIPLPAEPAVADEGDVAEIEMPADEVAAVVAAPAAPAAPASSHGTLMIGSKPPCRILVDGKDTGLTTPNRAVRVPAGRRTITLVNDELGIRHSETVTIAGGRKAKMIRDLTGQIDG